MQDAASGQLAFWQTSTDIDYFHVKKTSPPQTLDPRNNLSLITFSARQGWSNTRLVGVPPTYILNYQVRRGSTVKVRSNSSVFSLHTTSLVVPPPTLSDKPADTSGGHTIPYPSKQRLPLTYALDSHS